MVGMTKGQWGANRRWRIALAASLAVNLLLIGVVGTWAARPLFRGPPQQADFSRAIDRMAHRLDDADAAILKRAYETRRDDVTRLSAKVRAARNEARGALRADPFDVDAFGKAMNEVSAARASFEGAIQDVVRESAVAMSAEGRRALARGPRSRD
jgi:uncharacterized membrane protein